MFHIFFFFRLCLSINLLQFLYPILDLLLYRFTVLMVPGPVEDNPGGTTGMGHPERYRELSLS